MQGSITVDELRDVEGAPVYTSDGEEVGHVGEIWYDDDTREAQWLKVGRGALGMKAVFVPVQGADFRDDGVHVPYGVDQLRDSPEGDEDAWEFSDDYDREYREHYGLGYEERGSSTRGELDQDVDMQRDLDVTQGEGSVTRSEEELAVGKREREAGRARLRKWVETDTESADVELRRETARVTREPIDQPARGASFQEEEVDVELRAEEPVVEKQTVAKERIGLEKDVESETQTVSDEVRKERVEVEGDIRDRDRL